MADKIDQPGIGTPRTAELILKSYVDGGIAKAVEKCIFLLPGAIDPDRCDDMGKILKDGIVDSREGEILRKDGWSGSFVQQLSQGDALRRRVAVLSDRYLKNFNHATEEQYRRVTELGQLSSSQSIATLIIALKDEPETRGGAIHALARIGPPAIPALILAMNGKDLWACLGAIEALAEMGPRAAPAVPALIPALKHSSVAICLEAARALGKIGPAAKPAIPALVALVKNRSFALSYARGHAAAALGELDPEPKDVLPALGDLLKDDKEEVWVREQAAQSLARLGRPAISVLLDALGSCFESDVIVSENSITLASHDGTRTPAMAALLKIRQPAVPHLIDALRDRRQGMRVHAAFLLGAMGPATKDVVPALVKALEDDDMGVRLAAARALGKIGPAAKAAVPHLWKMIATAKKYRDQEIGEVAAEALKQIR